MAFRFEARGLVLIFYYVKTLYKTNFKVLLSEKKKEKRFTNNRSYKNILVSSFAP